MRGAGRNASLLGPALASAFVLGLIAAACSSGPTTPRSPAPASPTPIATVTSPSPELDGLNIGLPPWLPETAHLQQRLQTLGLPPLGPEVTRVHFHVNLVVFVHGQQVQVPFAVGIDLRHQTLAEIHTHSGSGTIHIEAARPRHFTLGTVFDVWGVRFTTTCLGGLCRDGPNRIRVFVDGHPFEGDPTQLELADGQVIVVAFGTEDELPDPMPARYVYEGPPQP